MRPLLGLAAFLSLSGGALAGPDSSLAGTSPPDAVSPPLVAGVMFRDRLRSGGEGPAMVVLPSGSFVMGSPEDEWGREPFEGPQRRVQIRAFAMGHTEVSFAEWDRCVERGGCVHRPSDAGWGRGDRPVMDVSWEDAQQYMAWLSRETGHAYRLPSEAEWEYAARAGTTTAHSWGNDIEQNRANCDGCGRRDGRQTAPVRTFAANPRGPERDARQCVGVDAGLRQSALCRYAPDRCALAYRRLRPARGSGRRLA